VSMGLGPITSIYQARFNRYLHDRGLADTSGSRVWAFLGDGEMDEPESMGALTLASREGLDNLWGLLDADARERLRRLPAFVPHPRIAQRAREMGFDAIATEGADAGLIAGLLEWFGSHPLRPC